MVHYWLLVAQSGGQLSVFTTETGLPETVWPGWDDWAAGRLFSSGLFVFVASIALGAITGGAGWLAATQNFTLNAALVGAGAGAVGGLVATGFSPTTAVAGFV